MSKPTSRLAAWWTVVLLGVLAIVSFVSAEKEGGAAGCV